MKKKLICKITALMLVLSVAASSLSGCITTGILAGLAAVNGFRENQETTTEETATARPEEESSRETLAHESSEEESSKETPAPESTEEESGETETPAASEEETPAADQDTVEAFREFTDRVYGELLSSTTLGAHYHLADPEKYGIDTSEVTWGSVDVSEEALKEYEEEIESYRTELESFDYEALDWEGKLTYDAFSWYLDTEAEGFGTDLLYEPLGPNSGEQAMLPIDLAEYNFYSEEDIATYLELVRTVPDYFEDLIGFEKQRAEAGLFMEDDILQNTLDQIEDFLTGREDSFLLTTFEERLDELGISGEEKEEYLKENEDAVLNYFYPAYEYLKEELGKLEGSGQYEGGLCNYPDGDRFYAYLLKARTGSDRTPEEMIALLDEAIDEGLTTIRMLLQENPMLNLYFDETPYPTSDPNLCLRILQEKILQDYPEIPEVDYAVKYVDESLRDYLSPACFMIPPVDADVKNSILINCERGDEAEDIFITLAHEGYPGHLYQSNYFKNNATYMLRDALGTSGFAEGYATYVENSAFSYIDELPADAAEVLRVNAQISLYIYARVDLGIHAEGWDVRDVERYISDYFTGASDAAVWMYDYMRADPGVYENYAVGELEILDIENEARDADDFDLKEFHRELLDCSEAPFSVIRKNILE